MWLCAGDLPTHVQSVRVASPSEHTFGPPRQPVQPGAPKQAADISDCTEVDVNVEYLSGCQRSHAARLAIPVNPPFRWLARHVSTCSGTLVFTPTSYQKEHF